MISQKLATATGASVIQDNHSIKAVATDFGNLSTGNSHAIVQAHNIKELQSVIQFANKYQLKLTPRGCGYSQNGQSIAQSSFTLDLTQLNHISALCSKSQTITCEAGTRWKDLVAATLPYKMLPRVVPLNMEQTVGGLLSSGGIGSTSKTYGPIVTNLVELEVITGVGERIKCSRMLESSLYNAVLGGLGKCGVIASATLNLRSIKPYIRTFHLLYDSLCLWMHDQLVLSKNIEVEHVEGFCWTSAKGIKKHNDARCFFTHWLYGLQVGVEYDITPPQINDVLKDLHYWKVVHIEDEQTSDHVNRYEPRFQMMRQNGAWYQTHPWLECFINATILVDIMPSILDLLPLSLGDGHRSIMIASNDVPSFFKMPPGQDIICFAILPTGVHNNDIDTISSLEKVNWMLQETGGKRYLSGWLGSSDFDWKQHYGKQYNDLLQLKHFFDPHDIFNNFYNQN